MEDSDLLYPEYLEILHQLNDASQNNTSPSSSYYYGNIQPYIPIMYDSLSGSFALSQRKSSSKISDNRNLLAAVLPTSASNTMIRPKSAVTFDMSDIDHTIPEQQRGRSSHSSRHNRNRSYSDQSDSRSPSKSRSPSSNRRSNSINDIHSNIQKPIKIRLSDDGKPLFASYSQGQLKQLQDREDVKRKEKKEQERLKKLGDRSFLIVDKDGNKYTYNDNGYKVRADQCVKPKAPITAVNTTKGLGKKIAFKGLIIEKTNAQLHSHKERLVLNELSADWHPSVFPGTTVDMNAAAGINSRINNRYESSSKSFSNMKVEAEVIPSSYIRKWNEYNMLNNLAVLVTVEYCDGCEYHDITTRHDENKYSSLAYKTILLIRDIACKYKVQFSSILKPISSNRVNDLKGRMWGDSCSLLGRRMLAANIDYTNRVGAFEVQIAIKDGDGHTFCHIIHSKIIKGCWPKKSDVVKLSSFVIHKHLPLLAAPVASVSDAASDINKVIHHFDSRDQAEAMKESEAPTNHYLYLNQYSDLYKPSAHTSLANSVPESPTVNDSNTAAHVPAATAVHVAALDTTQESAATAVPVAAVYVPTSAATGVHVATQDTTQESANSVVYVAAQEPAAAAAAISVQVAAVDALISAVGTTTMHAVSLNAYESAAANAVHVTVVDAHESAITTVHVDVHEPAATLVAREDVQETTAIAVLVAGTYAPEIDVSIHETDENREKLSISVDDADSTAAVHVPAMATAALLHLTTTVSEIVADRHTIEQISAYQIVDADKCAAAVLNVPKSHDTDNSDDNIQSNEADLTVTAAPITVAAINASADTADVARVAVVGDDSHAIDISRHESDAMKLKQMQLLFSLDDTNYDDDYNEENDDCSNGSNNNGDDYLNDLFDDDGDAATATDTCE